MNFDFKFNLEFKYRFDIKIIEFRNLNYILKLCYYNNN